MFERSGNRCRLVGNVTIDTVPELLKEVRPMIRTGVDELDCSEVQHVDSSALAFLLTCKREARQHNHSLALVKLPASVLSLASLYGVTHLLAV